MTAPKLGRRTTDTQEVNAVIVYNKGLAETGSHKAAALAVEAVMKAEEIEKAEAE